MLDLASELRQANIMTAYHFSFCGPQCAALPSGALHLPDHDVLCVSDLHLGKSERIARRSGVMLPPYEVRETLEKLQADIAATRPTQIICLGDSFDDLEAAARLDEEMLLWLAQLQEGKTWIWIEGNHDPGPINLGGTHRSEIKIGTLSFRHIATETTGEVSGHYHPKHRVAGRSRPAFLCDDGRLIMPAYGAYTGGLASHAPALRQLFMRPPIAIMTGHKAIAVPVL
jgi:DNA ligase-associated metallophosphoesterase